MLLSDFLDRKEIAKNPSLVGVTLFGSACYKELVDCNDIDIILIVPDGAKSSLSMLSCAFKPFDKLVQSGFDVSPNIVEEWEVAATFPHLLLRAYGEYGINLHGQNIYEYVKVARRRIVQPSVVRDGLRLAMFQFREVVLQVWRLHHRLGRQEDVIRQADKYIFAVWRSLGWICCKSIYNDQERLFQADNFDGSHRIGPHPGIWEAYQKFLEAKARPEHWESYEYTVDYIRKWCFEFLGPKEREDLCLDPGY